MKIIFASHNQNKVKEIQNLLGNEIQLLSLTELGLEEDIPETANTIEGNSLLKAKYIWEKYQMTCFADDTGLEIEALNGEPGVFSARYAGDKKNDDANIDKVLFKLSGHENRNARFKTVITLINEGQEFQFTGIVNGEIGLEKIGQNGFGYDPIFVPEKQGKTFAEMTLNEKNLFSHRACAFHQLVHFITEYKGINS
ncbi:MAG: non-canonical purine NTP diphosphatase [Bacteroidetes bacterium]|nr:non-canonical purine NTP diphosphatase [Bacteroidota bacterium]